MNIADSQWLVIASLATPALGLAIWQWLRQRKHSVHLRQRFGTEYDRAVDRLGGRRKAEAELKAREQRVEGEGITALTVFDVATAGVEWSIVQRRFLDNPREALVAADQLVREVMQKRGYRITESERGGIDVSADSPAIVAAYCKARGIAASCEARPGDTEVIRRAVLRYRMLLNELLEVASSTEPLVSQEPLAETDGDFATQTSFP